MNYGQYIYKKEIDWSVLHEGFSIPVSTQVIFHQLIEDEIARGSTKDITLLIGNEPFSARLINQDFNQLRYPSHKDLLQIRYSKNSPLANKLRLVFNSSYEYLRTERSNIKRNERFIKLPEDKLEYLVLYTSNSADTFIVDYITVLDIEAERRDIAKYSEEELETVINYRKKDFSAGLDLRKRIIKVRRLDRAIADNLKMLYDYRCQICGDNFADKYNTYIVEAHHLDSFITSLNNDSDNIVIICPNHHRIIHKTEPIFHSNLQSFVFPNGLHERLLLNYHL